MAESNPYQTPSSSADSANGTGDVLQNELEKSVNARNGSLKGMVVFAVILGALRVTSSGALRKLDLIVLGGVIVVLAVQAVYLSFRIFRLNSEIDQVDSA